MSDVIHRLASALDSDDYDAAERLMEPQIQYETDDAVVNGAHAVINSFRHVSEWGRDHLESLRFMHRIDERTPYEILFIDILEAGAESLILKHRMHVTLSARGLVERLRLESQPEEKDVVWEFFKRHGLIGP